MSVVPQTESPALAKGLLFRGILEVLERDFGGEMTGEIVERASLAFSVQKAQGFIASAWYPEALLLDLYRALGACLPSDTQERMGYLIQRHMLGRAYKLGVLLAGTDRALGFAPKGHSLYLTRGRVSYKSVSAGEGELCYEAMPLTDEPGFRLGIAGSYRALIEISGAQPLQVTVRSSKPGEARIRLRWQKS